jgi:basic membrane protein A and related proteins
VKRLFRPGWLAGVAVLAVVAVAAGCGSGGSSGSSGGNAGGSSPSSSAPEVKIGLVTDIGGLNDRSFNHLAFLGLQRAEQQLGVKGEVLQSNADSDYVPNLQTAAAHGDNLVIAVGFLMESAVEKVA